MQDNVTPSYDTPPASEIFRMPQRSLLLYLFRKYGKKWLIAATVIVLMLAAVTVFRGDIRWLILALMIIFIIIPMVMAFLYFKYALLPDISFNTLPHSISLLPDGLLITIYPTPAKETKTPEKKRKRRKKSSLFDEEENRPDSCFQNGTSECGMADNSSEDPSKRDQASISATSEEHLPEIKRTYPYDRIGHYEVGLKEVYLDILSSDNRTTRNGFIYLPSSAFSSAEDLALFLNTKKDLS